MMQIKIKRNTLGDTRTATRVPDFYEFVGANNEHREDVSNMMNMVANMVRDSGKKHDNTKMDEPHRSLFYRELCEVIEKKMDNFEDGKWYPMHCKTERHHLNKYCPEDVNLIDVMEMICDCVCAGMARSGSVRNLEISPEILMTAVENTVELCKNAVELEE